MNGQIELILRSTYPGLLAAIEAEAARLNLERELLVEQRDRLLDGMWGKGAPPPEELPQVGEGQSETRNETNETGAAFVAIIHPDDSALTFEALKGRPDVIVSDGPPLFRGELGTIDDGYRVIVNTGTELRTSDIAPDPREGITVSSLTALGDVDGPGTLHAGTVEHTPDTAAAVDAVKQAAEADDETVRRLNAQLDTGWRRVMDWRHQPNPFGQEGEDA